MKKPAATHDPPRAPSARISTRAITLALAVAMLLVLLPAATEQSALAVPAAASGNVAQRIEQLRQLYPHGSYFSVNRGACTHGTWGTCSNCSVHSVMSSLGYSSTAAGGNAWTCVAFARFASYYIFGKGWGLSSSSGWHVIPASEARPGDIVDTSGHTAMYLGNSTYFQSNVGGTNKVSYGSAFPNTDTKTFYRADNYDSINASATYTISYNANGGSGAPGNQTKTHGTTLTLSSTTPNRTGYAFQGWATSSTATSAAYSAGASFTANANTTLYAVWKPALSWYTWMTDTVVPGVSMGNEISDFPIGKSYYLCYTLIHTGTDQKANINTSVYPYTIKETVYNPNGSTLGSYSYANSRENWIRVTPQTVGTYKTAVEISGSWAATKTSTSFTVYAPLTYNANGGSGAPGSQKITSNPATLSSTKPNRTGYTFQGWATSDTATSAAYAAGASFTTNAATTLYAVWKANTSSVKFNANGGSGSMSNQSFTVNVAKALTANAFTRTGYTFSGWAKSATGTVYYADKAVLGSGASLTDGETVTLYAVWKANTYSVKFNANSGSGSMSNQSFTYGTAKALTANAFARAGYAFSGWATSASGSVAYTDKQSVNNLSSTNGATVNLYAVWKANTYTISYNANNGSGAPGNQTKTHGTALTLSSTKPTRTGYAFQGWATSSTASSAAYTAGGSFTTDANTTLFAVWAAITYSVKFNANGGTGSMPDQSFTYHNTGFPSVLKANAFTRDGYTFAGWATSASGAVVYGDMETGNLSSTNGAVITLYAVWQQTQAPPPPAAAPTVGVGSATAKTGETVTVPITVADSPATSSLEFILNYDAAKLELTGVAPAQDQSYSATFGQLKAGMPFVFAPTGTDSFTAAGTVLTLTFAVKPAFASGETEVSLTGVTATNADDLAIAFAANPGKITVKNTLYGDFTGNGVVDGTDTLWILRYIASGRSVDTMKANFATGIETFDPSAADFTNNGTVDGTDTLWILRYVASGRNAESLAVNFPSASISFGHLA